MTHLDPDTVDWSREPAPLREELVAAVITPTDGPKECTLYPPDIPDERLVTTWMTAGDGGFVSLDEMR